MNEGDLHAGPATWSQLLRQARAAAPADVEGLDAEYLLAHVLRRNRAGLYARLGDAVTAPELGQFLTLWQRRCAGEPYAYLTGEREFYGRPFQVNRAVLIPRPDTEILLEAALARWSVGRQGTVLDAGTGSGALAISFQLERPQSAVVAVDRSRAALDVAQANARRLGARVGFWCGDWLQALVAGSVDLILSNPPYLDATDPHLPGLVASGEPESALLATQSGLGDLLTLVNAARDLLSPGGWLLMEHGWTQAPAVREALLAHGYVDVSSERDLAGHERVSGGRVP
ncbi:MAG: peptide chain release factor N(5)-glutamine methyltransferase [Lysobacterales bacterium]